MRTWPKTQASIRRISTVLNNVARIGAAVGCLAAVTVMVVMPSDLASQQRRHDRILILTPQPEDPQDSNYVREMTQHLRTRVQNKFRHKWQVIEQDVIEDLFVSSGFPANTIIGPEMVDQVGKSLQANGYMYGVLKRNGATPSATYRMVDVLRSGLSGWVTVQGQPGDPPRSFADRVADSLDNQVRAADLAKECNARRDRSDFDRARSSGERAFELYENHPSTAICLSYVFQALQYGVDSVVWAYEKATRGDSLLIDAWEDLAREYVRAGDTVNAVGAYQRLLANDPGNEEIRATVAMGYFTTGRPERGEEILDEGLQRDPENMRFIRLKQQMCLDSENWPCALEVSELIYERDTTRAGDMEFLSAIIGLATTVGDTAKMIRWYEEAYQVEPESQQLLIPYAGVLEAALGTDSAVFLYRKLAELNPTDIRYNLKVIEYEVGLFAIDTTAAVPLDMDELNRLDAMLQQFAQVNEGNDQMQTWVGGQYLGITQKIAQSQLNHPLAIEYAEKALSFDRTGALEAAGNFWLGFSLFFVTYEMDAAIMESKSCSDINVYERNLRRTIQALTAGRSISAETVDQFMPTLQQLSGRPAQFREYFKCGGS
jgi:tetratricopeptide (TPR) repeat protein